MQVSATQLGAHLDKGLRSLYVLHGDEPLLVQEAADAIRASARRQGFTERTVFTVAGAHFDWAEVLASGASMGLFGDRQLVEVRIPSGKPGKEGSAALQQLAERAADSSDVLTLVSLPRLDKATKSSAWFEALEAAGRPLPMVMREQRIWGGKERLFERIVPGLSATTVNRLLWAAHQVDGIVKGLRPPAWPHEPWQALQRLAMMLTRQCRPR